MTYADSVLESRGEYLQYEKILKDTWKTWKLENDREKAKDKIYHNLKELPKETARLQNVCKGIEIKVYAFPDHELQSFVLPGFYVGVLNDKMPMIQKLDSMYRKNWVVRNFWDLLLATQLESVLAMRKYRIDPKRRTVTFLDKNVSRVSVFVSYGLLVFLTPEQRLGIYLHELGHWVVTAKHIPIHMEKNIEHEKIFFNSVAVIQSYITRYEELEADAFAKEVGYGPELSSALAQFGRFNTDGMSLVVKRYKNTLKKALQAKEDAEERGALAVTSYPSISYRQKQLK